MRSYQSTSRSEHAFHGVGLDTQMSILGVFDDNRARALVVVVSCLEFVYHILRLVQSEMRQMVGTERFMIQIPKVEAILLFIIWHRRLGVEASQRSPDTIDVSSEWLLSLSYRRAAHPHCPSPRQWQY